MSKRVTRLFVFVTLVLFAVHFVHALDAGSIQDNKVVNTVQTVSDADARTTYLQQSWVDLLSKSPVGRFFLRISSFFTALSPVFKVLIGIDYSLSWIFFLSLGLWVVMFVIIYRVVKEIFQTNQWVAVGIAVIIPALGARNGLLAKAVLLASPFFGGLWRIILSIALGVVLLLFYSTYMKLIGKQLKESQKKDAEARQGEKAEDVERIHDIEIKASKR
ncbi:hypothetical protein KW805_01490 [Candidatus Pacearchaeota archaeon]|nr:hypothetical protein [Candidatus Pacearchaeota archaeon]